MRLSELINVLLEVQRDCKNDPDYPDDPPVEICQAISTNIGSVERSRYYNHRTDGKDPIVMIHEA